MLADLWTTTVLLDPAHPHVRTLLSDVHRMHGFTMRAATGCRRSCDLGLLWRYVVRPETVEVVVQTNRWVDPDIYADTPGVRQVQGPFDLAEKIASLLLPGSLWRFAARVNPSRQVGQDGQRVPLYAPTEVRSWLERQTRDAFTVAPGARVEVESPARSAARRLTLHAVTVSGRLIVSDPVRAEEMLAQGIGRGRAYGFGLLQVEPLHTSSRAA